MTMTGAPRISAADVRRQMGAKTGTVLVCAYDDADMCRQHHLEGAIHLQALQSRLPTLPKDAEIVFYCA